MTIKELDKQLKDARKRLGAAHTALFNAQHEAGEAENDYKILQAAKAELKAQVKK